ncbi:hypothetical protein GCM10008097_27610 [Mycetocola manganoxydans]|nr:hypothetical protein GCM10008097_27610 [Mycetocola manganoxydans]
MKRLRLVCFPTCEDNITKVELSELTRAGRVFASRSQFSQSDDRGIAYPCRDLCECERIDRSDCVCKQPSFVGLDLSFGRIRPNDIPSAVVLRNSGRPPCLPLVNWIARLRWRATGASNARNSSGGDYKRRLLAHHTILDGV